jgi:hypothetical protein
MIHWTSTDGCVAVIETICDTGYTVSVYDSESARLCASEPNRVLTFAGRPNLLDIAGALAGFQDSSPGEGWVLDEATGTWVEA